MFYKCIQDMYQVYDKLFTDSTSCEYTSLFILNNLQQTLSIKNNKKYIFNYFNSEQYKSFVDNILKEETFLLEICLYKRSHTFLIFKENNKLFLVQSYHNVYKSFVKIIPDDALYHIYEIEFYDNIHHHEKLFEVKTFPCSSLLGIM
jgi:hypothetical protein